MRSVSPWAVTVFALGCSFDASGIAESSAAGPGVGSSTGGPGSSGAGPGSSGTSGEAVTTGGAGTGSVGSSGPVEPGTGGSMTTEPGTTTGPGTTTTGPEPGTTSGVVESTGPMDESTTTGAPVCPQPYTQIVRVKDASVVAPMGKFMSGMGEGVVAYSAEAEQGIVTFPFELPCAAQVAIWARVQDADDGVNNNDPDSFYPHVDNEAEAGWPYGCQTEGLPDGYHWLPVRMGEIGDPCDQFADLRPQLAAGAHTISLRNREPQSGQAVAAVARVLVTSDLAYVPKLPD